ncbi:GatB/YqeY domain-containing protein [Hazenella coriacea]|uniref:GatB/YqeY domain-containing protein n=1 Tax=Hazenella coriacea TaxID=1179467 RepID=A0A4R3L968_9BACL|nr:GatB/YqeY domain-containing protein [Hazenella coriacea]TCS94764.1 hypothetical protein EDD58_103183 [Hazenella coriacea]
MTLLEKLMEDMKTAMKSKQQTRLSVIRMLRASVKKEEIDKRRALNDEEVLEVIIREIKQRKDSITQYEKAGREDLAQKEKEELAILEIYLPEQLSEQEVRSMVEQVVQELGATSKADMGKVMGAMMPKVKGRADGRLISRLVQEALN